MEKLPDVIAGMEDCAKQLQACAKRLRKAQATSVAEATPDLTEADRALLELHHRIVHWLARKEGVAATGDGADVPSGEIGIDELTRLLYGRINPPESRRNYTYTPPFSIERVLRAYLDWTTGPGKGVAVVRSPESGVRS